MLVITSAIAMAAPTNAAVNKAINKVLLLVGQTKSGYRRVFLEYRGGMASGLRSRAVR